MAKPPTAIRVSGVSKDFRLPAEQRHTLKERVVNPRFDRDDKLFHALSDISFEVAQGEFFGIVGRNGSGKSTLLKCMAGIYKLDRGSIAIAGRLSTFIELGVGFNPDLAARDNIILNGIMLGLSPKQAAARVDDVIAFAELQDHVDLKLKNYSSGMQVRLAFSVMTQIDADVLLIDEVLAVGDASFQAKCFEKFRELRAAGKTIVLVTHDMGAVQRFCDRALLLEDGVIRKVGDPSEVGDLYLSLNFDHGDAAPIDPAADADATAARVIGGAFLDIHGQPIAHARSGEEVVLAVDVECIDTIEDPKLTLYVRDADETDIFGATVGPAPTDMAAVVPGTHWRATVQLPMLLRPGHVRLRALLTASAGRRPLHRTHDLASLDVVSLEPSVGAAALPYSSTWSQLDSRAVAATALAAAGGRPEAGPHR